jgi:hypothetical protein
MGKFCLDYKLTSCDEALVHEMYYFEQIEPVSKLNNIVSFDGDFYRN